MPGNGNIIPEVFIPRLSLPSTSYLPEPSHDFSLTNYRGKVVISCDQKEKTEMCFEKHKAFFLPFQNIPAMFQAVYEGLSSKTSWSKSSTLCQLYGSNNTSAEKRELFQRPSFPQAEECCCISQQVTRPEEMREEYFVPHGDQNGNITIYSFILPVPPCTSTNDLSRFLTLKYTQKETKTKPYMWNEQ